MTAVGLAIGLVAILSYPTVPGFLTEGRLGTGDGYYSIWNVAWVDHALLTTPRHLLDANIFWPHTGTLAYSELNLVAGLLGLPFYVVTGGNAIAATNGAILVGLVLAFVCMWVLVRRLTGSHEAALCSATMFTFCPYVQVHTAHIQLLMIFGLPLTLLAFEQMRARPGLVRGAWLGAALAIAGLGCAYYGIFTGLALGLIALVRARREARYWVALGAGTVAAALITLPAFLPYQAARAAVGTAASRAIGDAAGWSASWSAYASSPAWSHVWVRWMPPAAESVFPGLILLIAAAIGVTRVGLTTASEDRRTVLAYLTTAVFAAWASFGPAAGLYAWLATALPPMTLLRTPVRFGIVVVFALAVVAGFGIRHLASRRRRLALTLVPIVAIELAAMPWPLHQADPVARAYAVLAVSPPGAVVEFLFPYERSDYHSHAKYMFASTYHWHPLVNGYSDVIPPDFDGIAAPINGFPDDASFAILRARDVRYVLWHVGPRGYTEAEQQVLRDRIGRFEPYLRKLTTADNVWLYEITGWPPVPGSAGR